MTEFINYLTDNEWPFAVFISAILLGLAEIGYRIGLRLFERRDEARRSQIGGVQGAVLGLLGLLLGFTFSMGVTRYEMRRDLVLKEANCIGTTWLRAGLLPEGHQAPTKALLKSFVKTRIETQASMRDRSKFAKGLRDSAQIESELWKHAEAAAKEAPTPITATFIVTLNEMIDTDAERITAGRNAIPAGVVVLVVIVAGFGCLTSAYAAGAVGARSAFANVALPLLITFVIVLIFDITHSQQGFINIDQQPMHELEEMMEAQASGK